ncbi:pyrimidodiazepine synthase-like [Mercenaria mercenaria]|uniref:pyrimidodiazepine synthase-like n=1 Tax=Mercenaria mercenaria TaxID=6596 RepID=UPI00234EEA08|nr:pyrimidodiazepine synthase-like [Mercenaria mercenaria]
MSTQKAYGKGSEFPALQPGKLRLYSMRFCPYAQRALILLIHRNIEFEVVNINLKQKPEWFLELAPLGTVPVIQKDDIVVYDSPIVCQYLDETYPGEKLTPIDPLQKAKDAMLLEKFSKKITKPFYQLIYVEEPETPTELMSGLNVLEDELKLRGQKFFGGEQPMMIDFMIWPFLDFIVGMGRTRKPLSIEQDRFPCLSAWIENITSVPAVKETICPEEIFMKVTEDRKQGKEYYDVGLEDE